MELLEVCWNFLCGLASGAWGLLADVWGFVWGILSVMHVEYPRLEGLLVGVALAWLMGRRDKHPLLRAASAPLKLVLDILDLAWDHVVDFVKDVWAASTSWIIKAWGWTKGKLSGAWGWMTGKLTGLRDKLKAKRKLLKEEKKKK
tara:strand:- start:276 stop:710 length:435 start_codon:yes stop_codon:yes gene_type:complete